MSLKGVRQLKELLVRYSDIDGSSRGIRQWIRTDLIAFAEKNPTVLVRTEKRRAAHPFVRGHYLNGNTKTICIKNIEPEEIRGYVGDLRNQIGRKVCHLYFLILFHILITTTTDLLIRLRVMVTTNQCYRNDQVSKASGTNDWISLIWISKLLKNWLMFRYLLVF